MSYLFTIFLKSRLSLFVVCLALLSCRQTNEPEDQDDTQTCDCRCENTLIRNGEVIANRTSVEDIRQGTSDYWSASRGTPQVGAGAGCSETPGYLQMWGNRETGEGVSTPLIIPVTPGKSYQLSACVLFWNDNPANYTPYVRVVFRAINSVTDESEIIGKIETSKEEWNTHTLPDWTPSEEYDILEIYVENNNIGTNSASWARVDGICLKKVQRIP